LNIVLDEKRTLEAVQNDKGIIGGLTLTESVCVCVCVS